MLDSWIVVLPDRVEATAVRESVRDMVTHEIAHPSGRPWILCRRPEGAVAVGQAGHVKIAVIGQHAAVGERLAQEAGRVRTVADLERPLRSLPGSFHLLASVNGQVRVQGSVSSHRRVFHARLGDMTVAADRAGVLARLVGSGLDERRLALWLLDPPTLHALTGQPVWRGVSEVPGGHYLTLGRDGRHRSVRWWSPPAPELPMADGAPAFRAALSAAVDTRVRGHAMVGSDLGGVDSTSVCCLAARGDGPRVVAFTVASADPMTDDVYWARLTAAGLGGLEHHVVRTDEMPASYDGLLDDRTAIDEPCLATVDLSRFLVTPRRALARGCRLHLTGYGGDELLLGSPSHLHRQLRHSPRTAMRTLRGYRAKERWSYREVLWQLADLRTYRSWLRTVAKDIADPSPPPQAPAQAPALGWGRPPRLPPWTTRDTAEAVRGLVAAEIPMAEPLAAEHGQHAELEMIRTVSRIVAQIGLLTARLGITLAAPYHDDRVIEAALAVRPEERITPWRYKPLLTEAMRGIVPKECLHRQTKADGSYTEDQGLRSHRADLLALCEGSRLERYGLIDADRLRAVCRRPAVLPEQIGVLYQTVACEVWLRSLEKEGR